MVAEQVCYETIRVEKDAFLFLVFENGLSLAYLKALESQDSAVLLNSSMSFGYEISILSV